MEIRVDNDWKMVPIDHPIPYEKNSKKHPAEQIKKLAEHIKNVGFDQPIVVDEDGIILKGHGRLMAAKKLKMKDVPIVQKFNLTEAQKLACRVADNKLAETGWDNDFLRSDLIELKLLGESLEDLGFSEKELKALGMIDGDETNSLPEGDSYKSMFEVVVECMDEAEQQEVYERLAEEGLKCRILSM